MNKVDTEYFRVVNDILTNGRLKKNRTGIDTIGIFGAQAKYDINLNAFPILTTKKVHFPAILHELIWFIKGDTNIKYLVDNNVRIWNEWAYKRYKDTSNIGQDYRIFYGHLGEVDETGLTKKFADEGNYGPNGLMLLHGATARKYTQDEFIQKIKDCPKYDITSNNWNDARFAIEWGELGEGTYGGMWRKFPYYDGEAIDPQVGYVDQLQKVVDKLKSNPDDRRMIVSAWHPYWVDHCALPPCHCLFHFNTEELTFEERVELYMDSLPDDLGYTSGPVSEQDLVDKNIPKRRLNCLLYQRSCDFFLGVPFNITSYALLTAMIAHCVNMVPGTFTHTYGDAHVYTNHIEQFKTQMAREPKALPKLWINPEVKNLFAFKYEDIRLENYDPHPPIKGVVAV